MRWTGHVAYNILVRKPEGKRPLSRPILRRGDNTGMDFGEIGWKSVGWMHLAEDKDQWRSLVNIVINFRVP
jgi:hypothetical protein